MTEYTLKLYKARGGPAGTLRKGLGSLLVFAQDDAGAMQVAKTEHGDALELVDFAEVWSADGRFIGEFDLREGDRA